MRRAAIWFLGLVLVLMEQSVAFSFDIILDPGHSTAKPGALSCSGTYEVEYNERLVRVILTYLQAQGIGVDVTRKPGEDVSLMNRARKAQGKKLFLSLHHDSAQPQFLIQKNGTVCSRKAQGYSLFVSQKNPQYEKSLAIARVLGGFLREQGLRPSRHHGEPIKGENRTLLDEERGIYRFDDLVVLKNAQAPAILLEAAVIVHPEDDARARSREFHLTIAEVLAKTFRMVTQDQIR